jgi:hypothetical protein
MSDEKIFYINVYSHYYKITGIKGFGRILIDGFLKRFRTFSFGKIKGKPVTKVEKVYAAHTAARTEFRFNINTLENFMWYLKDHRVKPEQISITKECLFDYAPLNVKMKKGKKPRDYQVKHIEYLSKEDEVPSKLLGLQTGKGKGFVSIQATINKNKRTLIIILPKYIEKWVEELKVLTTARDNQIMTVKGGDQIRGIIELALNDELKASYIIISNRTFLNYIKAYEQNNGNMVNAGYQIPPDDFFKVLKIGILMIDEVHQDFFGNFKIALYSNVELLLGMSATLISEYKQMNNLYGLLFPVKDRCKNDDYDKYIHIYPVRYQLKNAKNIRHKDYRQGTYSHVIFEQSIMRNKPLLADYLTMIRHYVETDYIRRRKPGDKLAIFAATIDMCTLITENLKIFFKDLDIRRYVEDDPYENVIDPDIRVSTIQSSGTAVDIPGLITVIQTISILSQQSNVQTLGRLRNLPGKIMRFYYLYCAEIEKQKEYHERRVTLLESKVASINPTVYNKTLGDSRW